VLAAVTSEPQEECRVLRIEYINPRGKDEPRDRHRTVMVGDALTLARGALKRGAGVVYSVIG
jgi:hypothetical protein